MSKVKNFLNYYIWGNPIKIKIAINKVIKKLKLEEQEENKINSILSRHIYSNQQNEINKDNIKYILQLSDNEIFEIIFKIFGKTKEKHNNNENNYNNNIDIFEIEDIKYFIF